MTGTLLSYIVQHGMLSTVISQLQFNRSSCMAFMPKGVNSTILSLIPKSEDTKTMRSSKYYQNALSSSGSRNFYTGVLN